jgi:hypothetical protein
MKDVSSYYEKELQAKHDEVMALMKNLAKKDQMMLRNLVAPIYIVEGSAFVDETQQPAWNNLVKKYTKVNKNYGALIDESLRIMRSIEIKGVEGAIRDLVDLESDVSKVVAIVNKYSVKGNEFVNVLVDNNPKIVEVYPALPRIAKKGPAKVSEGREEYNKKGLEDSIMYMSNLVNTLKADEKIKESIAHEQSELEAIKKLRSAKNKERK